MDKILLLSVLGMTLLLPVVMASDPVPRRGLRRTVLGMVACIVVWGLACSYLYAKLLG
jgi:hypothetical protein